MNLRDEIRVINELKGLNTSDHVVIATLPVLELVSVHEGWESNNKGTDDYVVYEFKAVDELYSDYSIKLWLPEKRSSSWGKEKGYLLKAVLEHKKSTSSIWHDVQRNDWQKALMMVSCYMVLNQDGNDFRPAGR